MSVCPRLRSVRKQKNCLVGRRQMRKPKRPKRMFLGISFMAATCMRLCFLVLSFIPGEPAARPVPPRPVPTGPSPQEIARIRVSLKIKLLHVHGVQ